MSEAPSDVPAADELVDLAYAIERLTQRIEVLTSAVDQLTDEVQFANRNMQDARPPPEPVVLKSMPLDPAADDWQLDRTAPEDISAAEPPDPSPADDTVSARGQLFAP